MKNVEHFGDLTPRMNHFRDAVLEKKPYIDSQSNACYRSVPRKSKSACSYEKGFNVKKNT